MRLGYGATFQNPGRELTDREVYREEIRLARLAEPLGFDSVWSTEHHVTGYQMCPDVLQFLSYMAGTSDTLELGSMVVVIPWHPNPARVAEQIAALDNYCDGRLTVGFGRGSGRIEFEIARRRHGRGARALHGGHGADREGLETGTSSTDGADLQAAAHAAPAGAVQVVQGAASTPAWPRPGSIQLMAKPGLGILLIPQRPWEDIRAELEEYRGLFRSITASKRRPRRLAWVFCDEDEERAREEAERWMPRYWRGVIKHYDFAKPENFKGMKGYENYVGQAQGARTRASTRSPRTS